LDFYVKAVVEEESLISEKKNIGKGLNIGGEMFYFFAGSKSCLLIENDFRWSYLYRCHELTTRHCLDSLTSWKKRKQRRTNEDTSMG